MQMTDADVERLALEKYPKDACQVGGCTGLKDKDKNAYERKIWIDGFKAALLYLDQGFYD